MTTEGRENDRLLLSRIIIYGLSLSFSVLFASLEALRPTRAGFTFQVTWKAFATLLVAGAIMVPCFRTIVHSEKKKPRRIALAIVVGSGVFSFFYPLRFVPREKMADIFTGLGLAIAALSAVGGCLLMLQRWFKTSDTKNESVRR